MNKVILFSILYLVLVLVLVILLFIVSKNRTKYVSLIGWIITLFLTLAGFFLAIGNEFFSQFDYDCKRIVTEMFHPQDTINFSEIKANSNKINPHYFFLLDVSKSIKNAPKVKLTNTVSEQIDKIRSSAKFHYKGVDFDVKDDSINYYRLTQVRLMYSILRLSKRHMDSLKYSVVFFATVPQDIPVDKMEISDVFDTIYKEKYKGENTDFIALLSHLYDEIVPNVPRANRFKKKDCYLVFFSDYLHDVKNNDDKYEIEMKLKSFILEMRKKSIYIKLYCPREISGYGLPVISLFEDIFPKSVSEMLNEDDELICPIISKTPISFFYNNSVFEKSMSTHLTFDSLIKKKELSFGLEMHYCNDEKSLDDMKQEYNLIDGTDTVPLSTNLHPLTVDLNHSVELMIEGYIPAPYTSPDIVIQDKDEGIKYIIPVSFYKKFPWTGIILLAAMLVVVMGTILLLFGFLAMELVKRGKKDLVKSSN